MKNTYLLTIAFILNCLNLIAQNPTVQNYIMPSSVNLCDINAGFGIRHLDLSPVTPPSSYTISLQVFVVTTLPPPGQLLPYPWQTQYPDCNSQGSGGNNPVDLSGCNVSQPCNLQGNTVGWNTITHSFDWQISGCSVIEIVDYSIYLDCSIFSMINNPTGSLYLIQQWYYEAPGIQPIPFATQPLPILISFPYLTSPNLVNVPANHGNTENWFFAYQNTGTGTADILFNFTIDPCTEYNLLQTQYGVSPTPNGTPPLWYTYSSNSQVSINVGDYLIVKQIVDITGCAPDCGPINYPLPVVPPVYAHFSWRCKLLPLPNDFCSNCYEQSYETELHFTSEQPLFTVTRTSPPYNGVADQALHSTVCLGSTTTWKIKVENTSQFTELPNIEVKLGNGYAQSLSIIRDASISFVPAQSNISCSTCTTKTSTALSYPPAITSCSSGVPDPVSEFVITITKLKHGEYVTFEFEEYHCCTNNALLLDAPKFFNQWQIAAVCTTACGDLIGPDASAPNHVIIAGTSGINGDASDPYKDIDLGLLFSNPNSHTVVPNDDPAPYYKFSPEYYYTNVTGMFGNQDDEQVMGYSANPVSDISGIIKADIEMQNPGMLLANPYDGYFQIPDPANAGSYIYWYPQSYFGDFPCNASEYYINAPPCFYPPNNVPTPPVNPTNEIACDSKTLANNNSYCLYFNTADLPGTLDPSSIFYPTPSLTKFRFKFYACCTSDPQTYFKVSFHLLPNTTACPPATINDCTPSDCFLPLTSIADHTTVHCPGCKAPGIIVNSYKMERTTLGFPDATDNRLADSPTQIAYTPGATVSSNPYSAHYGDMALFRSTYGDNLNDFTIANFTDGDYSTGGYTYCNMTHQSPPINLDVVQLYREFLFSGSAPGSFNVQILGFDFYIDDNNFGVLGCPSCSTFYDAPVPPHNTIFNIHVDATSPAWSTFFERGILPDDDKFLFTFTEQYLTGLINGSIPLPLGVTINLNGSGITGIDYMPDQVYRMRTYYKVCGNVHDPNLTPNLTSLIQKSDITDYMYLIGSARTLYGGSNGLLLNSNNLPVNHRMPNTISIMENSPFSLTFATPNPVGCPTLSNTPCGNCQTQANQSNFANEYYFYCEPSGGRHEFYGIDCVNSTTYSTDYTADCNYTMTIGISNTLQRKTHLPSAANEFFPYEFKPLNLFPHAINVQPPTGWNFVTNGPNIDVSVGSYQPNYTFTINNNYQLPGSANSLSFNFNSTTLSPFNCFTTAAPGTGLFIGDEYEYHRIIIPCKPATPCPTTASTAVSTECEVTFSENTEACHISNSGCGFSYMQPNMYNTIQNNFFPPDPNLQCTIWPASINASTNTITWNFEFLNPSIPGSVVTNAKNVYIAVPQVNYLNQWQINYAISGHYPYPWSPINTSTTTSPGTLSTGGYFWITPQPQAGGFNYFPVDGTTVLGTISAVYDPCTNPADFDFIWGWNCSQVTVPPYQTALCMEVKSPHSIVNEDVYLVADVVTSVIPSSYTACGPAQHIRACFKNIANGELVPTQATITVAPNMNMNVMNLSINACGGAATYSITSAGAISVTNGNGFMHNSDCFCIGFDIEPGCNIGDLQLPTVTIQWDDYCGTSHTTDYNLPIIPPNTGQPTACTDCFTITKTPDVTSVVAGIETVTYTITVCSNNISYNSSYVTVNDNFPPGFIPNSNPFPITLNIPGDLPLIGCNYVPITVSGTFDNSVIGQNVCNEAVLDYTDAGGAPAQLSAFGCVDVLDNCTSNGQFVIGNSLTSFTKYTDLGIAAGIAANPTITVMGTLEFNSTAGFFTYIGGKTFYMSPGAEIHLAAGSNFLFLDACTLQACSKMWKGITMLNTTGNAPASRIWCRNTHIYDAEKALEVRNFCTAILVTSEFKNNYAGIYIPDHPNWLMGGSNQITLFLLGSTIHGTGTMGTPFVGQQDINGAPITSLGSIPLVGIWAGCTNLNLNLTGGGSNYFDNLSNGIKTFRCNTNIENCVFQNIQPEANYSYLTTGYFNVNYNGSAIYANKIKGTFSLNQQGLGKSGPYSFLNCNYGIFADGMNVTSELNNMGDAANNAALNTAFRITAGTGMNIHVRHNTIDTWHNAIDLYMNDASNILSVYNNEITFGDNNTGASYTGINVQENWVQDKNSMIHWNNITHRPGSTTAATGIETRSTLNFTVVQNHITMTDNHTNHDAILIDGCKGNIESCNHIQGSADFGVLDQSAIRMMGGDGLDLHCNEMSSTENGIYLYGTLMGALTLKGNEFGYHTYGLHYGLSSGANPQDFNGNLWTYAAIGSGKNAQHDNFANSPIFNKVHSLSPPLMPFTQLPSNWFQPAAGTDYGCSDPVPPQNIPFCNYFPYDCKGCRTAFDDDIASDNIENDPFTDETRWMLKFGLLEKIESNPDAFNDDMMNAFYAEMQGTALAGLKAVDDSKKALFDLSDDVMADLEQRTAVQQEYLAVLKDQMITLNQTYEDGSDPDGILADINGVQEALSALIAENTAIVSSIGDNRTEISNVIEGTNADLPVERQIETNEQSVNRIYLSTIAREIYEFTDEQVETLFGIANQCPLSGGNAVFRARALYALVDDAVRYNDRQICGMEGIELRQAKTVTAEKSIARIYPNPTSNNATLEYDIPAESQGEFSLYTATGQRLFKVKLNGGHLLYTFNTSGYYPGVYHYELRSNGTTLTNGKLVIIR